MVNWYVKNESSSYSNINGTKTSKKYYFENSDQHKKPIENCYKNDKIINCNKTQISDKSWFSGRQQIPITTRRYYKNKYLKYKKKYINIIRKNLIGGS